MTGFVALVLVGATGCGAEKVLNDQAACPGATCTADVQGRRDALAALDRVSEVQSVERSYGLDRGSFRSAVLGARVGGRAAARTVALEALDVLQDWPEHDTGAAVVTVVADPPVTVPYVALEELELSPGQFDACSDQRCAQALEEVRVRVGQDYDDVEDLRWGLVSGTLEVTARTDPDQVALVAAAVRRYLIEIGARVADRVEIEVRARGRLTLTLRLEDGLACEQAPGVIGCSEESERFDLS